MYVAITRAKERLWLTRSRSRYLYGRREITARSKFVNELEGELGIPKASVSARYSGDFIRSGYESGVRTFTGGRGYGAAYGVRKTDTYSEFRDRDEGFRTFGAGSAGKAPAGGVRFGNAGVSAPQAPRRDTSGFAVGVHVRHARFGDGVVTAVRGSGGNVIITVNFDRAGNKDLAAALAPLEILG